MRKTVLAVASGLFFASAPAAWSTTFVMDFEAMGPAAPTASAADGTTYTEDGMTMTRHFSHFDRYRLHPALSPDGTNHNPVIHEGNGGAGVDFSMGGTPFDLLSIDIIGWFFGDQPVVTFTNVIIGTDDAGGDIITATAGSASNPRWTWDFTGLPGFTNITAFSLIMPNPDTVCVRGNNCPNFAFDNVTFRTPPGVAPIPLPAGLPLLLTGLGALGLLGRRKRKHA